jgi:glycosyltransferase involved in cell wall biosynthesis
LKDNLVIIPTYNEIENIEAIIRKVMSLDEAFDVLIIDDGSPDGTGSKVKELQADFPEKLFIEERSGKLGLGTAYIHGFQWALERGYAFIYEMRKCGQLANWASVDVVFCRSLCKIYHWYENNGPNGRIYLLPKGSFTNDSA